MPNDKEINNNLFDQLSLLDRIERVALSTNDQAVLDEIAYERKLYQNPPLIPPNNGEQ